MYELELVNELVVVVPLNVIPLGNKTYTEDSSSCNDGAPIISIFKKKNICP